MLVKKAFTNPVGGTGDARLICFSIILITETCSGLTTPWGPRTPDKGAAPGVRAPRQGSLGPVWLFLLSSVAALPGLAVPLGDETEISPEQSSPPELGLGCEKSQGDLSLLCHPKSSASCHWPFPRVRQVICCISQKPSRPGTFLRRLGGKSPGHDCWLSSSFSPLRKHKSEPHLLV